MMVAMRSVRRLPENEIVALRAEPFTYAEVGATQAAYPSGFPAGYHLMQYRDVVGHGAQHFADAAVKVMSWRMHLDAGLQVATSAVEAAPGEVVVCRLGLGRLSLRIPCRVVYVVDEPFQHGFGYGTLPGHPESGEESFMVALDGEDVTLTVSSFTRPGTLLSRLSGPIGPAMAHAAIRRYAAALR